MPDREWRTLVMATIGSFGVALMAGGLARSFHATSDQALRIYFLVWAVMIPYAYRCFL